MRRYNRGRLPIVNPDDIARSLDPARINDRAVQLQAARLALAERAQRLSARENFAVETTLSGHSELEVMRQAGALGFKVNLLFVGLAEAELSSNRVALRVTHGGHDVPVEDVARRFGRILANLPAAIDAAERAQFRPPASPVADRRIRAPPEGSPQFAGLATNRNRSIIKAREQAVNGT
jgi:predicted ABC-type ATPase